MIPPLGALRVTLLVMVLGPLLLLATLGLPSLVRRPLGERAVGLLTGGTMMVEFLAALTACGLYVGGKMHPQVLSFGAWFAFGSSEFALDFVLDGYSLGFVTLCAGTCGVVAAFSSRYLHREKGFNRYFVQFSLFALGITLVALAGCIELQFAGWEFLGLSSTLMVGFFHERRVPVANAFRVFAAYRVGDAAMLGASVLLHYWSASGSLSGVFSGQVEVLALETGQVLIVLLLLLVAVACKSALLPFSGWLPRAMEGPTPSSAVYYGALSIHAGCYLLIRAEPLLVQSNAARVCTILIGVATAAYATVVARVQSDVKSAIAYSALTQVGLIVLEIGCGFPRVAFVHLLGHSCFRLLQLLASPNILHDLHALDARLSGRGNGDRPMPRPNIWLNALYLPALERGFLDASLERYVIAPFYWLLARADRADRFLCGQFRRPERRKEGAG